MTHGGELLPPRAAQCDITLTCLPFVTGVQFAKENKLKKDLFFRSPENLPNFTHGSARSTERTSEHCVHICLLARVLQPESDKLVKMTICAHRLCVVREIKTGQDVRLLILILFSPGPNWCVVFPRKLSETLQVQTPAVPPGPCQPPRLVGKPKAREVQLRWGESFLSNSNLCGMQLLLMHLFV